MNKKSIRIFLPFILLILLFTLTGCESSETNENNMNENNVEDTLTNEVEEENQLVTEVRKFRLSS